MKHLQICLLLMLAFAFTGCGQTAPTKQAETPAVETAQLSGEHFLIDVRSQKEWDAGHLETAIHIPHTEIVEGIKKVTDDKSAKIYFYWKSGGRAGTALEALKAEGFTNVENLGGMDDAKAAIGNGQ